MAAVIKLRFFSMTNLANCSVIFNDKIGWTWSRVHCSQAIQFATPLSLCPERAHYRLMYDKSSHSSLCDLPFEVRSRVTGRLVPDVSWSFLQGSTLEDEITKLSGLQTPLSSDAAPYSRRKETSTGHLRNPNNSHLHIVVFLRCIYRWRVSDRKVSIFTAYNEWAITSLWFILIIKLTRCTNFSNLFLE
jgi:hypothetical protein